MTTIGTQLKVIHNMWIKKSIEPSHIINYLDHFDLTLGFITLGGISAISKDKKEKYEWTIEKNNTQI
tara:strand:- start:87 stop:287 length:201 start_codon:yes stop_codon:yes gene_type:complete